MEARFVGMVYISAFLYFLRNVKCIIKRYDILHFLSYAMSTPLYISLGLSIIFSVIKESVLYQSLISGLGTGE